MSFSEQQRGFRPRERGSVVELLLLDHDGSAAGLIGRRISGHAVSLTLVQPAEEIPAEALAGAAAAVVEVAAGDSRSVERFQRLAAATDIPLLAAVYEAPLALVRSLLRAGAHDVLPLPLEADELDASIAAILQSLGSDAGSGPAAASKGQLVSVIKSGGGVGATALLTQLAIVHAGRHGREGAGCCVLDLDLQFGDAAFQLGLQPPLSVMNLLSAGHGIDHVVVQAAAASHPSGLKLIAAPADLLPLDSVPCDQLLDVVDVALETFDTIFLDLPANWTDWSLSLVARSTLVLLVTEMTIPALRQARRQLDLLDAQDLGELDLRIVLNRHHEQLFRTIKVADAADALGRPVNYTVDDDPALMRAALDQGLALDDIKRRSGLARDLARISDDVARLVREDG